MCFECPYKLPAILLRKQAERVVMLGAKLQREILSEWDIDLRTERLLCYAIEPILRQYVPDYQHDDFATAESLLSLLWAECGQKSLYPLERYENELAKIRFQSARPRGARLLDSKLRTDHNLQHNSR